MAIYALNNHIAHKKKVIAILKPLIEKLTKKKI